MIEEWYSVTPDDVKFFNDRPIIHFAKCLKLSAPLKRWLKRYDSLFVELPADEDENSRICLFGDEESGPCLLAQTHYHCPHCVYTLKHTHCNDPVTVLYHLNKYHYQVYLKQLLNQLECLKGESTLNYSKCVN